ncbi:5'-methylthioadenosine nucleosidase [Tardiphaga robiniae]|uniref:5'-methylthioadenosine nucleosidase n=1 Tax=Tardiphaga robiniae TaxID=943830 RepID=A0A7G6U661_9BRAD|nr:5'-methylthioadenosine nucleosidase [Tardiphaga robiniae]QND74493.1 5'-methylthioadenosine nucleosidase [Tardiphaga robiniae]
MSDGILVLTALDSELDVARAPAGFRVIFTGVGKINTTIATLQAIQIDKPKLVVNYGTAGKLNTKLNGLVEVSDVIQRDMNAEPLAPRGRTPYSPELDRLSSGRQGVICGTGDSFVTSTDPWLVDNSVDVVDMELFAIAQVCLRHGIPWRAFKFITDDANDFAHEHWTANVANGQDLFWDAMKGVKV